MRVFAACWVAFGDDFAAAILLAERGWRQVVEGLVRAFFVVADEPVMDALA